MYNRRSLIETGTFWDDRELANSFDARFFEGGSETRLAHATLGGQTPFTVLAPASLLEPGVDSAPVCGPHSGPSHPFYG